MKKIFTILLFTAIVSDAFAYSKYWITFTDKNGTPYTTGNPSAYLSARSIQRRANQNIPVTWYDLPVNPSYVTQVLATGAVTLNYKSRWLNAISITTTDAAALAAIHALPFVTSVDSVKRLAHSHDFSEEPNENPDLQNGRYGNPSTTSFYNYGISYGQVHQINVDCLHDMGYHGEGKVIAVLDDGFNSVNTINAFDSIRLNNQILGTWDFVAGVQDVYAVGGHGTMCLSDMASYLPGQIMGTAPKADYWLLRTEDATTEYIIEEDNWVAGAEFADSVGADIISTSLYYTQFDDATQNHTYADMNGRTTVCAIAAVFTARVGMLTFACAGNSGQTSWFYVGSPADADSVMAVGAVDVNGNLAGFSSRGPSYDRRIKPDIAADGVNAVVVNSSASVTTASGTSFATPLSAGGAACLWQSSPTNTAMQLRHCIQMSASQWNAPDSLKGYGIPDYCAASTLLSNTTSVPIKNNFSVYPNPNNGEMVFSLSTFSGNNGKVEIYDATGKLVRTLNVSAGEKNISVNEENLNDGIYFCRFIADGKELGNDKMVIVR